MRVAARGPQYHRYTRKRGRNFFSQTICPCPGKERPSFASFFAPAPDPPFSSLGPNKPKMKRDRESINLGLLFSGGKGISGGVEKLWGFRINEKKE